MIRPPFRIGALRLVCLAVVLMLPAGVAGTDWGQTPQQGQAQASQQPVFRGGTNLVEVDLYPTKDGRILEGLTPADLEVRENGQLQTIENMEFIRIEPTPATEVRDPANTREMFTKVADAHNRVFVLYIDRYHLHLGGSFNARRAIVDLLNRVLAPNDLFAVLTTGVPANILAFGRRTDTLEQQLAQHWWELADRGSNRRDEEEDMLAACYETTGTGQEVWARDGATARPIVDLLKMRRREDLVLTHLDDLIRYLGSVRESRKSVIVLTEGWVLFQPDRTQGRPGTAPPVGVRGGQLVTNDMTNGVPSNVCATEFNRLFELDNQQRFRTLLQLANQMNVTFYPVNPSGLQVFDSDLNERVAVLDPQRALQQDMGRVRERADAMLTLAENTDGVAVISNDLNAGLRQIVDDVSAYYVLTYASTNIKPDGAYRRIEVKVKQPDVRVRARRGYFAPTEKDVAAARTIGAEPEPGAAEVEEAFGALSRLRLDAPLFTYGVIANQQAAVVVELTAAQALRSTAATAVQVELTKADGTAVGKSEGQIAPATRGTVVRVPLGFDLDGPWRARITVGAGRDRLQDSVEVREGTGALVSDAIVYRATPSPRSPLVPAADFRFRRTERVHVEWARLADIDRREARLLGRDGKPLAVPVAVTEREVDGQVFVAADVNLAPLVDGEYAVELVVGGGGETERRVIAIRVTR
jgi:VWFA-related protein